MRIVKGKKNMASVMGNAHFGELAILKSGFKIIVPTKGINNDGTIKRSFKRAVENINVPTVQEACELGKKGFAVIVA